MDQPDQPREQLNPYQAPTETGQVQPAVQLDPLAYKMPPLHWPRTIGMFTVLAIAGPVTQGTTLVVFAFPILFGGIRTALIFQDCYREARVPPSYLVSTFFSPFACFAFQAAGAIAFSFVCATRVSNPQPVVSEQAWFVLSAIIGLATFAGLYIASIKVTVANCRRVA